MDMSEIVKSQNQTPAELAEGLTPEKADQLALQAEEMIASVATPEEAEQVLKGVRVAEGAVRLVELSGAYERRWSGLKLRAEARWGELLGEPRPGNPGGKPNVTGSNVTGAERKARNDARRVADVQRKHPQAFEDYIKTADRPSRAGLLRSFTERPRPRRKTDDGADQWKDERVLTWVAKLRIKRTGKGATRDDLMAMAKAGEHGWRQEWGKDLNQNAADRAIAIVEDRAACAEAAKANGNARAKPRRRDSPTGTTATQRRARVKENEKKTRGLRGRDTPYSKLVSLQLNIDRLCLALEALANLEIVEHDGDTVAAIFDIWGSLIDLGDWRDRMLPYVQAHITDADVRGLIEKLEAKAASTNFPEEAESFRARAKEMKRKLENRLDQ